MNYMACNITLYGNCREAVDFYQECFRAEVTELVTYDEVAEQLNFNGIIQGKEHYIYRAKMVVSCEEGKFMLMLGDSPSILFDDQARANMSKDNLTINIGSESEDSLREIFAKLSVGGKTNIEPRITTEGIVEGSLIDRFGICWILRSESLS